MRFAHALTLIAALALNCPAVSAQLNSRPSAVGAVQLEPLCKAIGAEFISYPGAPLPTCRLAVEHQGRSRFADVYFPAAPYNSSSEVPLWIQLHGLYKANWPMSSPKNDGLDHMKRAAEHVAAKWGVATGWLANKAVLVYPDSTGDAPGPQMWNSGFWQCPFKSDPNTCVDGEADDVGFLEKVTQQLLDKLPAKPTEIYAAGFSNGGMILTTMLCKSAFFRSNLAGAALINTVLTHDYLETQCSQGPDSQATGAGPEAGPEKDQAGEPGDGPESQAGAVGAHVPLVFIHGLQDPLFPFAQASTSATGDELLSTLDMVDAWATKYSCPSSSSSSSAAGGSWPPLVFTAGEGVACRDYCYNGEDSSTGQPVLWLCGMDQDGHDWQKYKADLAWIFLSQHQKLKAILPEPESFTTWKPLQQQPAAAAPLPPAVPQPLPPTPAPTPSVPAVPAAAATPAPAAPESFKPSTQVSQQPKASPEQQQGRDDVKHDDEVAKEDKEQQQQQQKQRQPSPLKSSNTAGPAVDTLNSQHAQKPLPAAALLFLAARGAAAAAAVEGKLVQAVPQPVPGSTSQPTAPKAVSKPQSSPKQAAPPPYTTSSVLKPAVKPTAPPASHLQKPGAVPSTPRPAAASAKAAAAAAARASPAAAVPASVPGSSAAAAAAPAPVPKAPQPHRGKVAAAEQQIPATKRRAAALRGPRMANTKAGVRQR